MDQHPSPIARLSRELGDSGTKEILPPTERNLTMLSEGKLEELEPCPFCGGAGSTEHISEGHPRWSVGCLNEGCLGYQSLTTFPRKCEAIAAWNTRAQAPAPVGGEVVELLREVQQACLYAEDDGTIGVTSEPTIHGDLFDRICAALSPDPTEGGEDE